MQYVNAGPNPLFGGLKSTKSIFGRSNYTWVEGEGMLHALYFNKDHTKLRKWNLFYNNRYVQTQTFQLEKHVKNGPYFLPAIEGDSLAVLSAFFLNMVSASALLISFLN